MVLHQFRVAHDRHFDEVSRVELMDEVPVPYTMRRTSKRPV